MVMLSGTRDVQDELNRSMPAAKHALLGDTLVDVITAHNALVDNFNTLVTQYTALLAKLDADAGVTDTDYGATVPGTASTATVADLGTR
jgi:hypothetical protein